MHTQHTVIEIRTYTSATKRSQAMFTPYLIRMVTILNFPYEKRFSTQRYHQMTKLDENFKYEKLFKQTGKTNV